jgi:hypothetical protein
MIARRSTLANALRVAAEQYDADAGDNFALVVRTDAEPGQASALVGFGRVFTRQAVEARQLADAIENAGTITLED